MESILVALGLLLSLITLWIIYRKHKMSYFARHGIPGPPPHFIYGNFKDILECEEGFYTLCKQWVKKYGKVFGFYYGGVPSLFVADPELMKKIEVKDYQHFKTRKAIMTGGIIPHDNFFDSMALALGFRWRVARALLSPAFTSNKMSWMSDDLTIHMDNLVEELKEKAEKDESFDIYPLFQYLAFDYMTHVLFSVKSETLKKTGRNNSFFNDVVKTVNFNLSGLFMIAGSLPEFSFILVPLRNFVDIVMHWLNKPSSHGMYNKLEELIKARTGTSKFFREDSIKLMVDGSKTIKKLYKYDNEKETNNNSETEKDLLSLSEKVSNAFSFLLAGFETTSISQAFVIRFLVHHPDIQEKIYEEVQNVLEEEGSLTYKAASKLTYTEQVFSEMLRMYPVVYGFILREAMVNYSYNGMVIPKGLVTFHNIEIPHRSEEYWENPDKFDPDRFAPGKKIDPYVYQPFGQGPRQCVGIRVGQVTGRLILARLVNTFKFFPCDKSSSEIEEGGYKLFQIYPKNGVFVKVALRDSMKT